VFAEAVCECQPRYVLSMCPCLVYILNADIGKWDLKLLVYEGLSYAFFWCLLLE
jgi:hypothetical protein